MSKPTLKERLHQHDNAPRDFKTEFERYLQEHTLSQHDFAALLLTAQTIVFERDKASLVQTCWDQAWPDDINTGILKRLHEHNIL